VFSRRQLPELRTYSRVESRLPFHADEDFASLVVANGNDSLPVHGWFKYKEAFSADLVKHLIENIDLGRKPGETIRLLDPFCGVGTTLISSQTIDTKKFRIEGFGIECNPFTAFVARTKTQWPEMRASEIRRLATRILANQDFSDSVPLPELSSIRTGRCISRHAATQVLNVRRYVEGLDQSPDRDALLLGLASSIDVVSRVRRDGRALRLVEKPRTQFKQVLRSRWDAIAEDVEKLQEAHSSPAAVTVLSGDGRAAISHLAAGTIDLLVTSPPYPNNIDYNEVYKLELWLMGFVKTPQEFLGLRRSTFRSHPTCSEVDESSVSSREFEEMMDDGPIADLVGMIVRRARALDKEQSRGRKRVLEGYIFDTWNSLKTHLAYLRSGGCAVYVVGNSLHGGKDRPYLIPTDLIVSELAALVGFEVEKLIVARPLRRRLAGNHFLRDSVIVLRKR
jgi:hypothetical protein